MSLQGAIRRTRGLASYRTGISPSLTRAVVAGGGALVLAHLTIPGRPATLCPLRALTGIPCPFCGGTTAAIHLGRLDLVGALRANPFAVAGGVTVVLAPLVVQARRRRGHTQLSSRARHALAVAFWLAVAGSELWQLVRFGIL